MPASYLSPKTRIGRSPIHGRGLFATRPIRPNLGFRGQVTFIALRAIKAGEELTYDWAMEENVPAQTRCACRAPRCRKTLTGQDWQLPVLQRRYRGYFSTYLGDEIARRRRARAR